MISQKASSCFDLLQLSVFRRRVAVACHNQDRHKITKSSTPSTIPCARRSYKHILVVGLSSLQDSLCWSELDLAAHHWSVTCKQHHHFTESRYAGNILHKFGLKRPVVIFSAKLYLLDCLPKLSPGCGDWHEGYFPAVPLIFNFFLSVLRSLI